MTDYRQLLKRYISHVHKHEPAELSPEENLIINEIGLEIWPPSPQPQPKRIKILYLVDQYPDWSAPHPQPISNYRDMLTNRVDVWAVWAYMMQNYHLQPSFEDLLNRGKTIYFSPKVGPQDKVLTEEAKESLRVAANYQHLIERIFLDELNKSQTETDDYIGSMFDYMKSIGFGVKPLDMIYNEQHIMGNNGYLSQYIDRVFPEIYIDPETYQNSPILSQVVLELANKLRDKVGEKCKGACGAAYNRNGRWTNLTSINWLQLYTYDAVKSWAEEIWWFNLDRNDPSSNSYGSRMIKDMISTHDDIRRRIWS